MLIAVGSKDQLSTIYSLITFDRLPVCSLQPRTSELPHELVDGGVDARLRILHRCLDIGGRAVGCCLGGLQRVCGNSSHIGGRLHKATQLFK